jgi:EAL domain-containing protein (putative c-di-GMP-specific phosphodiesterase class I)/GGDEF domain-containing protein
MQDNAFQFCLIYIEINHSLQVARLLGGESVQEKLINSILHIIFSQIKNRFDYKLSQLRENGFGIIVKLPVQDSISFAEELSLLMDRECIIIDGRSYYPKFIIGISTISPEYKTAERILIAVDEALYQARRTGNSIVKVIQHDDQALSEYYNSLTLLPVLREGLLNKSFVLYAQPIVSIADTNSRQKTEILLRYKNKVGEIELPKSFLKTADMFHVSFDVDCYVLYQLCRFIEQKKHVNIEYSMNISGRTVRHPLFYDFTLKTCKRFNIKPKQICFEITETIADRDYRQAIELMKMLKENLGCQLALDDIGVGSSNLANLSKFNVDYMKIDGSFITNITEDHYSELVVNFIASTAKLFNKKTIAEHVENFSQLEKLAHLNIDFIQGYLSGKPILLFDPS